jgi:hypothetical protein
MYWVTLSGKTTNSAHGRRGKRFPQGEKLQTQIVHVVLLVSVYGFVPQIHPKLARTSWTTVSPIPRGIPCYNGAVLVPTQTGGQLWSVRDSFLPTDPLAKVMAARNNCPIERQPRPSTCYARGFDLSANGLRRLQMTT